LRSLELHLTAVSPDGVAALKAAIPNLKVEYDE
jgi:hypothetical protein